MDSVIKIENPNPIEKAGVISKIFFAWIVKLCYSGVKRPLNKSDLYKCLRSDESELLTDTLENEWKRELEKCKLKNKQPSLMLVVCKMFAASYVLWGLLAFVVAGIVKSFQPTILGLFIQQFSNSGENTFQNKLIYGSVLVFISLLCSFCQYQLVFKFAIIGMRIRVACCSLVYRKILRLSTKSLRETAAGQVINLLSNDVSRFDIIVQFLHFLWMMPIQVGLLTYLIWREVGISSIAGVITMLVMTIPLQGVITKFASILRLKVAQKTDRRIKLMDQLIGGIQVIKMYVWEEALAEIVKKVRASEISSLTKFSYLRGILSSMSVFMERFITFITIMCFTLLGNTITAEKVFAIASFYNVLQFTTAICYPLGLLLLSESKVSMKRIQTFLELEEKEKSKIISKTDGVVSLNNVNAYWIPDTPVLSKIDVQIPAGTLCAIVGQVGSGKSSLLQLLLGELTSFTGDIEIGGNLSYSSQDPWIFESTVRKNILFGQRYDKVRYDHVTSVCALKADFKQFPYSDKTVVGEKGISLSGGQRARINLARAVYRQADIYLLDDPLSAVDTNVGKHLFEKCIIGYLRNKTRILVTHQLQYLKKADFIVVLDNGRIEAQGTFDELSKSTLNFTKLLAAAEDTHEEHHFEREFLRSSILSVGSESWEHEQREKNEEGLVHLKKSPYKSYLKHSSNFCIIFLLLLLLIVSQAITSGCDYWTAFWTRQEELRSTSILNNDEEVVKKTFSTETSLIIYSVLIIASIILTSLRSIFFYKLAMNASKRLHGTMFSALLKAPMRFFDVNPLGRILNRFSKDMGIIDELLPRIMLDALTIFPVMGGIVVNVTVSNVYMLIAGFIVGVLFYFSLKWYIAVARDVRQLEGIAKSPVFTHLSATFSGLATIRATQNEIILAQEFDQHQDTHTSAWFVTISCISAFGLWMDLLSVIFIGCVTFSFIFISQNGSTSGSAVGLAVQQSLILVGMLSFGVRQIAELVSNMIAVERVLEYTELEKEEVSKTRKSYPSIEWPSRGVIVFKNLFLTYASDKPAVLKDLNFTVNAGEKIGIVGRTGAGKSSLIGALFRLAKLDGSIYIDGVDTQIIPLAELRKRISIIPQEPVLFSESLRYNLDPFNEYDDKKLWTVLDEVELKDSITSLDMEVQDGGNNFSVGQRQLICLARAILRNNKILVLDEATANVDPRTDSLIQTTIRNKFRSCTVLTIAHRLNTVIDSDKILVMDGGALAEYDHPHVLLKNPKGFFYRLISQMGPVMEQQLHEAARKCYEEKFGSLSMDCVVEITRSNSFEKANIFSKMFFWWMLKFCFKGIKRQLEIKDLFKCTLANESEKLADRLEKKWNEELRKAKSKSKEPSLMLAIIKAFIPLYISCGIWSFVVTAITRSLLPLVLSLYLKQFSSLNKNTINEKWIYGGIILLISTFNAFVLYQVSFVATQMGMRVRIACSSLIYRKLLRLSLESLNETTPGKVVNLLSNDVMRFDMLLLVLHYLWIMPVHVILLTFLIWREVGIAAFIGIITMLLITGPMQYVAVTVSTKVRRSAAQKTDTRINLMGQLVAGIQVIKMFVWEDALAEVVRKVRADEISSLTKIVYLKSILSVASVFTERFATFITIISFALLGNVITTATVFSVASFYSVLQLTIAVNHPLAVLLTCDAKVSAKRLQQFLLLKEREECKVIIKNDGAISLRNVDVFWKSIIPSLTNITMNIPNGSLCAIVGPVGSGKSTLLQLLLGEITSYKGLVQVGGTVSYSSQEAWIFGATVRKNVLFGQQYDKTRYDRVVRICSLKADLEQFPYSDKTIVGEKGILLSGGQKARINLARAVYRKADIYLLDDPLSAVDAHVGKHMFEECILKYLKHKTRILVTHQLQYLKRADQIVVLDNLGQIEACGTFDELSKSSLYFTNFLSSPEEVDERTHFERGVTRDSLKSIGSEKWEDDQLTQNAENGSDFKKSPHWLYVKYSSNAFGLIFLFVSFIVSQVFISGCDYWTFRWTKLEERQFLRNSTNSYGLPHEFLSTKTCMIIYAILIIGCFLTVSHRSFLFSKFAMNSSTRLHANMFDAILRVPLHFFDVNPMGRILNRFSKDIGIVDDVIPRLMLDAISGILLIVGILVNVTVSNKFMTLAAIMLGIIFVLLLMGYTKISRDLRHLEGIAKSHVFSHLNATINGLVTIRSTRNEAILVNEFDKHQNNHSSANFLILASTTSFGLWLELMSLFLVYSVVISCTLISEKGTMTGSAVGLSTQQCLLLIGTLSYGMRQLAETLSCMTSVERIAEYIGLEKEQCSTENKSLPEIEWPSRGAIVFRNVHMRYFDNTPEVLNNLNFTIEANEKVGVVGRTGAGKSSLIRVLYLLTKLEGNVYIDGIDTQTVPLNELRKRITVIPQEPVLFGGSLRYNLDPFNEFDDKRLWNALDVVELKESVASLDMEVQIGGSNFSVGQRQLICLARAILRNNKILVLDEATANVDPKTDSLIQETIRKMFKNCTVITIAHRLNTVMDSDKILVMDSGHLVEFDHPYKLLQNKRGVLYKLVSQTGSSMEAQFHSIAEGTYYKEDDENELLVTRL
ncbi:probable multidrug resistance-associated protein lethal(2)03659 [Agrilus planipennis]|uniref:Probable multidrug resistance-associated protein lethal(2)03659 n=1 Tax=Agrilus planipennis TaxID=224129 RepID=A0A1W4WE28_AGRPL|nr:probable multidrug resistance-associated protein lethal(2)03659 [Agrilus planipennis]